MPPKSTLKTMTTSALALNSVDQKNGKKASRTKAMIAAAFVSLSGLAFMLPQPAAAFLNPAPVGTPVYVDGSLNI